MQQKSIADYILYDISKHRIPDSFGISSEIISEVVEGWNQSIYITPAKIKNLRHRYAIRKKIIQ